MNDELKLCKFAPIISLYSIWVTDTKHDTYRVSLPNKINSTQFR